ncbi:MAG: B12-binding domain-containing radical SAM protein [Thermodesulfovibrionales bacterium]
MGTVLLVNPNRYRNPPVVPVGLEYIAHALREHGFEPRAVDLCFSEGPREELEAAIRDIGPMAVCFTVRNVDSVLYPGTEYFLPEIKGLVQAAKAATPAPVIIGGAGVGADPEGVLKLLGADAAVQGPGETSLPRLLRRARFPTGLVVKGAPPARVGRLKVFDYAPYMKEGGVMGFETHKGCSSACAFCLEAGSPVSFRDPRDIAREIESLTGQGFAHFHLCDSEFNEDRDFSAAVLERISGLGIRWALYMKPEGPHPRVFSLLRRSGAYLVTFSVDTFRRPPGYWAGVRRSLELARENGIRTSVDLLSGFPGEDEDTLRRAIDFFREARPDDVVVNAVIRLYRGLAVTGIVEADPALRGRLLGAAGGSYLEPLFYSHVEAGRLAEILGDDPLFRVAGREKVVNYQKAPGWREAPGRPG